MDFKYLQYIAVAILLAYVYHNEPIFAKTNEYLFIAIGMLVFHCIRTVLTCEHYSAYNQCVPNLDENVLPEKYKNAITNNELFKNGKKIGKSKKVKLSKLEILNHTDNIINNLKNKNELTKIITAITNETDEKKKSELLAIFELTIKDPVKMVKMVTDNTSDALQTALAISENPNKIKNKKNKKNKKVNLHEENELFEKYEMYEENELSEENEITNDDENEDVEINKARIILKAKTDIAQIMNIDTINKKQKKQELSMGSPVNNKTPSTQQSGTNDTINILMEKINKLEEKEKISKHIKTPITQQPGTNDKINTLIEKINKLEEKEKIPQHIKKAKTQNKYIHKSDAEFTNLDENQYLPQVRAEDDNWDWAGYSILPPSVWRPKSQQGTRNMYQETQCPVCPLPTSGNTVNLAEWDDSRYVIGSDNIDINYIKKLNEKKI